MKLKKLTSAITVFLLVMVLTIVSIRGKSFGDAAYTFTNLGNINFAGQVFNEEACSIPGSFGNNVIRARISTNKPAGPNTSPVYNPVALYEVHTPMPVTQPMDSWHTAKTSTVQFDLPREIGSTTFSLGIEGYSNHKLTVAWGSASGNPYTVKDIPRCQPSLPLPVNYASCNTSIPQTSTNPEYPLIGKAVNFMSAKQENLWNDYGNEVQKPKGYVAASHAVFVPGEGLEIRGYPDQISQTNMGIGGVTGGSGDVNDSIPGSGGFDACFSMSGGDWQKVTLSFISWSASNAPTAWNEGELDIFEGSPGSMGINLHEIGPYPAINVYQGGWPAPLNDGGIHLISARWNPTDGYSFYLDGKNVLNLPVNCLSPNDPNYTPDCVQTPTTPHHLSIQMRDTSENSSSKETAIVYWTAAYSYNSN